MNQCWPDWMTHICGIRARWVKRHDASINGNSIVFRHIVQVNIKKNKAWHYYPFVSGIHSSLVDSPHKKLVKSPYYWPTVSRFYRSADGCPHNFRVNVTFFGHLSSWNPMFGVPCDLHNMCLAVCLNSKPPNLSTAQHYGILIRAVW